MSKRNRAKKRGSKLIRRKVDKTALPPGSLIRETAGPPAKVPLALIDYDASQATERTLDTIAQALPFKDRPTVTWINIDGLDADTIEAIGKTFGLHPLVQEDIQTIGQRPKCEEYPDYLFLVTDMVRFDEAGQGLTFEQVSLILGPRFVLSFQERPGDVFEPVRARLRTGKGRVRTMGADYLAYSLIDAIVDHYFTALEGLGAQIESLEEQALSESDPTVVGRIHGLRRELSLMRRSVWPMRDLLSTLQRSDSPLVSESVRVYLRDVYDHTIQVIDTVETFREMAAGLLDLHLAAVSNRMNAVMKVLTIIATIFIPLSFFAGVYGMNFEHMPELEWTWAYPLGFWAFIVVVLSSMLWYFRTKKWL